MCAPDAEPAVVVAAAAPLPPGTFSRHAVREQRAVAKRQKREAKQELKRRFIVKLRTETLGASPVEDLPSVTVVDTTRRSNVTFFVLGCRTAFGEWLVERRYTEFNSLRKALGVRSSRVGCEFPRKTGLGECKGILLEQRQKMLQAWLNGLLSEFATGGDGKHKLFARGLAGKCKILQTFFGCVGNHQPPATAVERVAAAQTVVLVDVPPEQLVDDGLASDLGMHAQASQALQVGTESWDSCGTNVSETETSGAVYHADVPPGLTPGEQFFVEVDGMTYALAVPQEPNSSIQFMLPKV